MLRNEVGWFDEEENSVDTLSMRLANDAIFVRAAFSKRLSILIQDSAAVMVAILIGMLLHWRLALVAVATLPVLTLSAIAQKLWLAGFSKGIQEMHRKTSLVLEDAVRNIYIVVAFCADNKVMELYRLQLSKIFYQSFFHGMAISFAFGFSHSLSVMLAISVRRMHGLLDNMPISTSLTQITLAEHYKVSLVAFHSGRRS